MIEIKVNGSIVSVQETKPLYSGSEDIHRCRFAFDKSWNPFRKSAVFRVGERVMTAVLDEDCCVLPWELLTRGNIGLSVEVGVYGVSEAAEVMTSVWDSIGTVRDGTELGVDAREPSDGVYEQVMASVKQVDNKVERYGTQVQTQMQRAESAADISQAAAVRAERNAAAAESAASALKNKLTGVENALDNLPEGDTLIINDLTTGGKSAALSAEMGKMLGRRPNRNLLDNWHFVNPVNQKGQAEYARESVSQSREYAIDRWYIRNGKGKATLVEDGILLEATDSTYAMYFEQFIDPTLTERETVLSLLVDDVEGTAYAQVGYTPSGTGSAGGTLTKGLKTIVNPAGKTVNRVLVQLNKGAKLKLRAIKLEYGTIQTLAHQNEEGNWVLNEIPDYAMELEKCRRYFQVVNSLGVNGAHLLDVRGKSAEKAFGTLTLKVPMRTMPSVSISGSTPYVWLSREEDGAKYMASCDVAGIAVSADTPDTERLRLEVTVNDPQFGFEENKWYDILSKITGHVGQATKIFLDANL